MEEFVIERVLNSLASLADLDLFQKMKLWELIGIIAPLICHPNTWIRYGKSGKEMSKTLHLTFYAGAISFIASAAKNLPQTDLWCIIYPLLTPFLQSDIADINERCLIENAKAPVSRPVLKNIANRAL